MVTSDAPPFSLSSSVLHQFIASALMSPHNQLQTQQFAAYENFLRGTNTFFTVSEEREMPHARHLVDLSAGSNFASSPPLNRSSENSSENSSYLKAVRSLLAEVVSVGGKDVELSNQMYCEKLSPRGRRDSGLSFVLKAELSSNKILSREKNESEIKIENLIALLEEVETRYERYYHQVEEVMSTFELVAGTGSGMFYTALALQAMSRHFCSLKDAIIYHINIEKRKLSQDMSKISMVLSQLNLFDQENHSNRPSLQHFGLIQSQRLAWRPIRGLPETSVAILRSWLFEHFLHPYPNHSEKIMLASQACLTKNQVSNWFINARVRLWKPMIEEMYKEEFGDSSEEVL